MSDPSKDIQPVTHLEVHDPETVDKFEHSELAAGVAQQNADFYIEALEKYGHDGAIDPAAEKRLKRWVKPTCARSLPAERSTGASCPSSVSVTASTMWTRRKSRSQRQR